MAFASTDLGPAWVGLGGVLAGGLVAGLFGWLTLKGTLRGQKDQRTHERQMAAEQRDADRELRRQTFQAQTLVELQLALARFDRAVGAIRVHDERAARTGGQPWGKARLPGDRNIELLELGIVLRLLAARVADEALRRNITRAHELGMKTAIARSETESMDAMALAIAASEDAADRIGELLRVLPPPDVPPAPLVTRPIGPADEALAKRTPQSEPDGKF